MRTDHPRRRLLALTAIGALSVTVGLASCGDDDTSSDTTPATIAVASTAEGTTPPHRHREPPPPPRPVRPGRPRRPLLAPAGDGDGGGAADHDDGERRHLDDDRDRERHRRHRPNDHDRRHREALSASATGGSGPDGSASGETAPPTTAGQCDLYTTNAQYPLKLCDTGYDVVLVQQALAAQGFDVPTSGDFDPATDAAVHAYQEQFGLTVDGLVGRETWTHLVPDAPGQDNNGNGVVDPFEVTTG